MMAKGRLWVTFLLSMLLVSLAAWVYQVHSGLIVTNMRNSFSWGLYIASFAFFVGIAAGGLIVSSSVYLFGIVKLKPFTKAASLSAFASTLGAAAMILPDLGRVDRIFNLLIHPNFRSPLIWDVIVITAYGIISFLSLYYQFLPYFNKDKSNEPGIEVYARGMAKKVAFIGLPFAILIHTVTALIFAVQGSRSWWNSAVLPPDFIAVAVASGTSLVLLLALHLAREDFDRYREAFKIMANIIVGGIIVHFFFMYADFLIRWWWGAPRELQPLLVVLKDYTLLHLTEVLFPLFTLIYFSTAKGKSSPGSLRLGSAAMLIGTFAHRLVLMAGSFNSIPLTMSLPGIKTREWTYPIATGEFNPPHDVFAAYWHYFPSPVEFLVALLPFAVILLVITVAVTKLPFLTGEDSKGTAPAKEPLVRAPVTGYGKGS